MSLDENRLIRSLKALPPNTLYFISPREFFLRGFEYYRQGRLEFYKWNMDQTALTAYVRGTQLYKVDLTLEEDELNFSCDCLAWTPSAHCKHVICALLTTLNLLWPDLFRVDRRDPGRLESLRSSLLNPEKTVGPSVREKVRETQRNLYHLVIDYLNQYPSVYVQRNGERMGSPWRVPSELAFFVSYSYFHASIFQENFLHYLNHFSTRYPVLLKAGEGEFILEWDPSLKYEAKTELDLNGDSITLRALCLLDGVLREKYYRFAHFVADLETRKVGVMDKPKGWDAFEGLYRFFHRSAPSLDCAGLFLGDKRASDLIYGWMDERVRSFRVPLAQFQEAQVKIPEPSMEGIMKHLVLKVKGRVEPILPARHSYRVVMIPDENNNDQIKLRAECRVGESAGMPSKPPFNLFTFLENAPGLPGPLKAYKRQRVIYSTFFKLLATRSKTEWEKVIKESLSGPDFHRRSIRSSAKNILQYFFSAFQQRDVRLHPDGQRWCIVPNDKTREALLYQIPFELFGPEIFKRGHRPDEMSISARLLFEKLSLLHSRLSASNIELFYVNKPVERPRWEFSFDIRRVSGIDWFEVKPEIRCNGVELDEAQWCQLLDREGVVEQGESIQVLDGQHMELLNYLRQIRQGPTRGRTDKKEIVQIPRLQILDWIYLRKQGVQIKLPEEEEALMARLMEFEKIERVPLPERLKGRLRPYQKAGYFWLAFHYRHRFGSCLADDMGLGKTVQAITLLGGIQEGILAPSIPIQGPHLIVVPASLLFNWENEIQRFYPYLRARFYTGKERSTVFKDCDVVITTYGLVRRDIEELKKVPFHVIVFDEAQAIKNIYADTTSAVRQLSGYFKLAMTGTPLENHLGEYYSIIDLCLPGLLGDYEQFRDKTGQEHAPFMNVVIRRTRPFVLRRTKEKILKELPPKTETDVYLELNPQQRVLYQKTVEQVRATIDQAYRSKTQAQAQVIALTAILKLRQICVSPRLVSPDISGRSPKIDFLITRLAELHEASHSALVFSQFTSFLDILEEDLKQEGIRFLRLDGSTVTSKRKYLVEGFQKGEGPSVFLLSLKAGGQGLNLTRASYVFHLDPWWNPAVENQASDRAHRIGQTRKVSIIRILMRHTIEEKMMELKRRKLALYQAVLEDVSSRSSFSIRKEDFDFLLEM